MGHPASSERHDALLCSVCQRKAAAGGRGQRQADPRDPEDRMQAALTLIEFMRDHLVPKLTAKDIHELRLAHETKNMVLNAEMRLRAGIFRTESRGCHYREDYTRRDDPDWLAWVLLKEEEGCMKAFKVPVPKEWWPDLTIPYEERYVPKFPE